jgi:transketolase
MSNIENLCINTIRILSAEGIQKANSGHPGLPMGTAPLAYELWAKHMRHNPLNPGWVDRDRFILSAGHGSMLVYSLLHLFGYGLPIEELKKFRQLGSKTPGHPEYGHTVGVETTTGPLGQGFANGVGMAIAETYLAAKFNRPRMNIVDHYTYVLSGDGCMMEGITSEAASFAGMLKLGKLIVFYDSNNITIEGSTNIAFKEDVAKRFKAYGWHIQKVKDGNNTNSIGNAIKKAKSVNDKPSLIIVTTQIGYGCPSKQGKASVHGEPLGEEALEETKKNLGWKYSEPFTVPEKVKEHMKTIISGLSNYEDVWNGSWENYRTKYPELAKEWEKWQIGEMEKSIINKADYWENDNKPLATRATSGAVINMLSSIIPNLIGGSADLAPSNKTIMKNTGDFTSENRSGGNLHFGVREHSMAAAANGIALHGGLIPYVGTFFVFSDYMKGAMRLSALMGLRVIYVLTHDSIGVGEDGPTHEPVEHLAALRSIPNFTVFRPADYRETAAGWYAAISNKNGPTALALTRQKIPQIPGTGDMALKGGYILLDSKKDLPEIILIASGSEVHIAYEAGKILKDKNIDARVVSMPSMELFEKQSDEYREKVLPLKVRKRLAVEAGTSFGWHKITGLDGDIISIDTFGKSAPGKILFQEFGFTVENVVDRALKIMGEK